MSLRAKRSNLECVRPCTGLPRRPKELLAMTKKLGIDCDCSYEGSEAIQKKEILWQMKL